MDALVLVYGEEDDDVLYSRAIAVQLSLFGYELSDTSMVFAEDTLHILTGAKKAKILEILGTQSPSSGKRSTFCATCVYVRARMRSSPLLDG